MPGKSRQRKSHGQRPHEAPAGKTVATAPATHKPWHIAAVCLVLAVVTVFAFRGVRSGDYIEMDDVGCVLVNRQVQQGFTMHSIEWAFTTYHCANWHPLTWISHMADWSFYGKSPGGHHLTNVYLHAANAVLLFLLLLYLTGFIGRAAMVAFLFALHPAHVESVAWISERKDILCAFFCFAALLAYAWYARRPSWKRFAWVVCCFACALMSKPMAVTLPFILLLLDYWPLRRITFTPETRAHWFSSFWKLCLEKWPLFIMAVISSVITIFAQRASGAVASLQLIPWWERLCNAAIGYCRYVRIMVWPHPLTAFYYYDLNHIMIPAAVLSAIALILATAVCWHIRGKMPYCLIGWLWFLGTLVPVIGIVQVGNQALAERYTYIPLIGLFIAVVWLAGDAVANFPKIRIVAQLMAVAVIIACAVKTDTQVKVWKDTVTLFSHVLEIDSRGEFPNSILGVAYVRLGRIAEAQEYLERALEYNSSDPLDLSYSAYCLMQTAMLTHDQRNLPLAGQRLEKALRLSPDYPLALTYMAQWSFLMGRTKDEETYSRKAIAGDPDSIMAWIYLGDALQAQGKLDEAADDWRQVLAVDPDNCDAHNNLGIIFDRRGFKQEALKEFRLSLAIKPDQALAHSKIGRILMRNHQLPEAVEEFTQALRYDPANASAHNDLGAVMFQLGDYEKAAGQFSEALRIDPAYADARGNLDLAQARMKNKKAENRRK
ncbi:MAG: tetratricopeptide repeat protein [Terracidiphilus sp.]|jgi:tetratricopeptide (TPR) repeat protein